MQSTTALPRFDELAAGAHWRVVEIVSDLHLQPGEPATLAVWEHYLRSTQADALLILGDLFELWPGDDALDDSAGGAVDSGAGPARQSFEARCAASLRAAAQRLELFFMPGNRDFLAGPAFLAGCTIAGLADPCVLVFGGRRLLLSHGDLLCVADTDYQRFRALVRSRSWQQHFLAQPLAARRAQAAAMRAHSQALQRSAAQRGARWAEVDGPAAIAWLQAARAQTLIHGHTHRPAEHLLGPGLRRLVLSDWDAAARPARAQLLRLTLAGSRAQDPERVDLDIARAGG